MEQYMSRRSHCKGNNAYGTDPLSVICIEKRESIDTAEFGILQMTGALWKKLTTGFEAR